MKVLVFGAGSMGRRHITTAIALGHDVRICDPLLDWTDAIPLHQMFISADAAWRWQPDAVIIASPASTHLTLMMDCAHHEVPFFVEKPLALDTQLADVREFVTELKQLHTQSQLGCNWRFHPLVLEMWRRMQDIQEDVTPAEAAFWVLSDAKLKTPGRCYEDALLECGAHEIDLALHLLGPAEATYALRKETAWRVDLRHASGCTSKVGLDDHADVPARGLRINWPGWIGGYDVPQNDPRSQEAVEFSYTEELHYFLGIITGQMSAHYDGAVPATLADGLAVLEIVARARALDAEHSAVLIN